MLVKIPELVRLKWRIGRGSYPLLDDIRAESISRTPQSDKRTSMLAERDLLSLDLSAHPLDFMSLDNSFTRIKDLRSIATGKTVKIAGSVIRYQTPPTRNGNRVVYVIMEDGTGIADVTVFGNVQEKCGQVLFREGWLVIEGKIQRRGPKSLSVIAYNLSPLALQHC